MHIDNIKRDLITPAKRIIDHHKEIERIKGESFNLFSILKMESNENATHSAFLGELLNPKGSHQKGNVFLKLFLEILELEVSEFDISSAHLTLEKYLGFKDNDTKQGGRIDIYLKDLHGNSICIENKIFANDQISQIERYHNHNKDKNKVIYLTLFGEEASTKSKGELMSNLDYKTISYVKTILDWLQLCLKEAAETPILRESIKQYIILIRKLTNTMENQQENELIDLIFSHYEEAQYIATHFKKAKQQLTEEIRKKIISELSEKLKNKYLVEPGNDTSSNISQIWIKLVRKESQGLFFGIESFTGNGPFGESFFIGIFNSSKNSDFYKHKGVTTEANIYWTNRSVFTLFEGYPVNFNAPTTLQRLHTDEKFTLRFTAYIVQEIEKYLSEKSNLLNDFLK